jgi:hypothetical protein
MAFCEKHGWEFDVMVGLYKLKIQFDPVQESWICFYFSDFTIKLLA